MNANATFQEIEIPKKEYVLIDEGLYTAKIANVQETVGAYGAQLKIVFALEDCDEMEEIVGWCSKSYTDKSNLFKWTRAALGADFDPTANFQASKLIGKRVMINVGHKTTESGTFNKVLDVIPMKVKSKHQLTPEPPPPPTDEDYPEPPAEEMPPY